MVVFGQKWLYLGKSVVFGESDCILVKVVVFVQKWLYSGYFCCILAKVVVFGQKL